MADSLILRYDRRSLVILDPDREWVFAADPLGRVVWVHTPETVYRRSRFNQWFAVKRDIWSYLEPVGESRIEEAVESWKPLWRRAREGAARLAPSPLGILDGWLDRFMDFHREDAGRFSSIYQHIPILPPDGYQSLYVQISAGCPWNRCLFCNFYRDRAYRVRSEEEILGHLEAVRSYWGGALGSRFGVFLGDANAVAVPTEALLARCRRIRDVFPEESFRALSSFADFFSAGKRETADFARLREIGLRRICLGIESGEAQLMERVQKPLRREDAVRAVREAHSAGVEVSLIFIVGLGGRRYRDSHFHASIDLLSKLTLARPDRVYLSPLAIKPELGYTDVAERDDWGTLTEDEIAIEMKRWGEAVRKLHPRLPVSLYNIRQFTY